MVAILSEWWPVATTAGTSLYLFKLVLSDISVNIVIVINLLNQFS